MRKTAAERKNEAVEAALRLAVDIGPNRVTTAAIAEALGVTQAALFRHFPRKMDIWMAASTWLAEQTADRCRPAVAGEPDSALCRLQALVCGQIDLIVRTPAIAMLLFSTELNIENGPLRDSLASLLARFEARLARLLDDARAGGEIRPDVDPGRVAGVIASLVAGTAARWWLEGTLFDLMAESTESLRLVLDGLSDRSDRRSD